MLRTLCKRNTSNVIGNQAFSWILILAETLIKCFYVKYYLENLQIDRNFKDGWINKLELWSQNFLQLNPPVFRRPRILSQHAPQGAEHMFIRFAVSKITLTNVNGIGRNLFSYMNETTVYFDKQFISKVRGQREFIGFSATMRYFLVMVQTSLCFFPRGLWRDRLLIVRNRLGLQGSMDVQEWKNGWTTLLWNYGKQYCVCFISKEI